MPTDPLMELIEAAIDYRDGGCRHALSVATTTAEAAGYPARREAELRVLEAARNVVRVDGNTWLSLMEDIGDLRVALDALDAATSKEPTT